MVRNIITICLALTVLGGCSAMAGKGGKDLNIQESFVPILYCPKPPVVNRPGLPIDNLTEADKTNPGKVVQTFKASIMVLKGYAVELETALKSYEEANAAYEDLRKKFKQQENAGAFDKISKEK